MVNDLLQQRREQMFPKLSKPQMTRLAAHGQPLSDGELASAA